MKPQLLKISSNQVNSFNARKDSTPDINNRWHYHLVLELIYFKKGNGTQYVGDDSRRFHKGDVALIGANLPHYWQFDNRFFNTRKSKSVEVYVVHFDEFFWGKEFINLPENKEIKKLIQKSTRGCQFLGETREKLTLLIPEIISSTGTNRIIKLLEVLQIMANSTEVDFLASSNYNPQFNDSEKNRIIDVYNYTLTHYTQKISLDEIATIANLNPSSFCKFFKSTSGKTYTQFVNEMRVSEACRKLIENQMSVKEICFACGFNNFTSFHEVFKSIIGKSPLQYQKEYRDGLTL